MKVHVIMHYNRNTIKNKVECIKWLRRWSGLGLKDAKELTEDIMERSSGKGMYLNTNQYAMLTANLDREVRTCDGAFSFDVVGIVQTPVIEDISDKGYCNEA